MNSSQTVTVNSALNQNWVGYTVRTPRTHVVHTLREQCPGRGRCCAHNAQVVRMSRAQPAQVTRMLRAQPAQVARSACAGRAHSAQVVGACRDLPALPSQTAQVTTSFPGRDLLEVIPCRDITLVSRHRLSCLASSQVATPEPGRDLLDDQPMSRHQVHVVTSSSQQARSRRQFHVATSWRLTYVATSISCRDIASAHNGLSRSRRQAPGRNLPRCYPCRDLKNDVGTSNQLSPISATSRRHSSMSRRPLQPPMSRPQNDVATSIPIGQT